jgi:hypothetical protein
MMSFTWDDLDKMLPQQRWSSPLPPTCAKCNYILTGLSENRCPECGTRFRWKEVRDRAARTWALALRLRHANQDAISGIICSLAGWFAILFVRLFDIDALHIVVDIVAMFMALVTIILGAQVLNVRRVPKWAREYIFNPPPRLSLGAGAMFLGITLMVGAIVIW